MHIDQDISRFCKLESYFIDLKAHIQQVIQQMAFANIFYPQNKLKLKLIWAILLSETAFLVCPIKSKIRQ